VYIVGVEEELFPSRMSFESPEDMEEERRLFYVAITRAKKRVYISYAQTRYKWGTPTSSLPSRFLRDIDPKFLDLPVEQTNRTPNHELSGDYDWDSDFNNKSKYTSANNKSYSGSSPQKLAISKAAAAIPRRPLVTPKPADPNFKADNPDKIQPGMKVEHATFGTGKILQIEGVSPNRKATVFFQDINEEKQLLLKFAKLRIV
jgi:DNA helicase-2/ATP-dependent DNA helicase PcrA